MAPILVRFKRKPAMNRSLTALAFLTLLGADKPAEKPPVTIKATIQSVDRAIRVVTLRLENKTTLAVRVTKDTLLQGDGELLGLSDIRPGQTVECTYVMQGPYRVARKIAAPISPRRTAEKAAEPPPPRELAYMIEGTIEAIDQKTQEVTILRANGKKTTVKVLDRTTIKLDGKGVGFGRIEKGQEVRCWYRIESKTADGIYLFVELDLD